MQLNKTQLALLCLVGRAGNDGCLIYGRGPTATIDALASRGLVERVGGFIRVLVMGNLEIRHRYAITPAGAELAANDPAHDLGTAPDRPPGYACVSTDP